MNPFTIEEKNRNRDWIIYEMHLEDRYFGNLYKGKVACSFKGPVGIPLQPIARDTLGLLPSLLMDERDIETEQIVNSARITYAWTRLGVKGMSGSRLDTLNLSDHIDSKYAVSIMNDPSRISTMIFDVNDISGSPQLKYTIALESLRNDLNDGFTMTVTTPIARFDGFGLSEWIIATNRLRNKAASRDGLTMDLDQCLKGILRPHLVTTTKLKSSIVGY